MSDAAAAWGEPHLNAAGSPEREDMKAAQRAARGDDQERATSSDAVVDEVENASTAPELVPTTATAPDATTVTATAPDAAIAFLCQTMKLNMERALEVLMEAVQRAAPAQREKDRIALVLHEAALSLEKQRRIDEPTLRILYANLDRDWVRTSTNSMGNEYQCGCRVEVARTLKCSQIMAHLDLHTLRQFDVLVFAELTKVKEVRDYIRACGFTTGAVSSNGGAEVSIYVRNGLEFTQHRPYLRGATVAVTKEGVSTTITGVNWRLERVEEKHRCVEATFNQSNPRWVIVGDFNERRNMILHEFKGSFPLLQDAYVPIQTRHNDVLPDGVPTSEGNIFDHVFASPLFRSGRDQPDQEGRYSWRCRVINRTDFYMRATEEGGTAYCFNHPMLEVQIPLTQTPLRIFYANLGGTYTHQCSCGESRLTPPRNCKEREAHLDPRTLQQFDVLVFAELSREDERNYFSEYGFTQQAFSSDEPLPNHERNPNNAVRIYVRNSLQVVQHSTCPSTGSATVTVTKAGSSTTITGVHWAYKLKQHAMNYHTTFAATFGNDRNARGSRWVIVGDFNETRENILEAFDQFPALNDAYVPKDRIVDALDHSQVLKKEQIEIFRRLQSFHLFISPVTSREYCTVIRHYQFTKPKFQRNFRLCIHPNMFEVQIP